MIVVANILEVKFFIILNGVKFSIYTLIILLRIYYIKFFQVDIVDIKEHGHFDALDNKCRFFALQKDHTNLGATSTE